MRTIYIVCIQVRQARRASPVELTVTAELTEGLWHLLKLYEP